MQALAEPDRTPLDTAVAVAVAERVSTAQPLALGALENLDLCGLSLSTDMNYAVFNPKTKEVVTIVTEPTGALPEGYEFVPESELPLDAVRVEQPQADTQSAYESALEAGFVDPVTKLHLKTDRASQTLFTSQVTLLQLATAAKVAPATTDIWDQTGAKRTLPLADFYGLMLRYGLYCQQLFSTRPIESA